MSKSLSEIVGYLRKAWPNLWNVYDDAIGDLIALRNLQMKDGKDNRGYAFDGDKFPSLYKTRIGSYEHDVRPRPSTLAEALLWKMGKWDVYKTFVSDYLGNTERDLDDHDAVVFFAFARHLGDYNLPIFDQHSARAIWVVSQHTWGSSKNIPWSDNASDYDGWSGDLYFHFLMRQKGSWKSNGDGDTSVACLNSFYDEVSFICHASGLSHDELDKLLMPLGQALKDYTSRSVVTGKIHKIETRSYQRLMDLVGVENHTLAEFVDTRKHALASKNRRQAIIPQK
jgi:hypothetical protein